MARGAQRVEASQRARSGVVEGTVVTLDRPVTQVRGPHGQLYNLPRRQEDGGMVIYHKVNGQLLDPSTGQRLCKGQKPLARSGKQLSFSAVALTAFIGFRVCQLVHRCFRKKQWPQEQLLLQQQVDDQQVLPAVRAFPAMLQRALPQLGPPSRVKRIAQQHRSRQRRVPNAHQKLQQRGVVRRKATTLEKWDQAVKQQVQALVTAQQGRDMQLGCGMEASAVLPLPGLGSSLVPPQPLLDVHQ